MRSEREFRQFTERKEVSAVRETEEIETQGRLGLHGCALLLQGITVCVIEMGKKKREGFVDVFTNCGRAAPK